jgi:23S rRNA pseudouridine1911/1915/1917 synthase
MPDPGPTPATPHRAFVDVTFTVEPNYAGWRLDRYLCEKIRRLSRTRVQAILARSLIADRPLKPSTRVQPGLTFRLRRRATVEPDVPEHLNELYRDDALLVLDKPAGLPIHPTARYHHNTLVKLLERLHGPGFQAHPAHRLDRETSGLLVCGRTTAASRALMRAFQSGAVKKEYIAIIEGDPPEVFEVDAPIAEGTAAIRIAVRIDHHTGKPAQTRFAVEERFFHGGQPFARVRCFPRTGRQHQIRIHAREAGFPLVGDKIYGPDPGYFDRFSKRCLEPEAWVRLRLPRHALHAARLVLPHPLSGQRLTFEAPLPQDLRDFCAGLRTSAEVGEPPTSALKPAA